MEKNLSNQDDRVEVLGRQLLNAEVVRAAHKPRKAFAMFQEALGSATFECLSPARQRWARAHAGTAATEIFEPYHEETTGFLEAGEELLWQALVVDRKGLLSLKEARPEAKLSVLERPQNNKVDSAYDLAWAWAKLGENYRLQGNQPAMYVTSRNGHNEIASRDNKAIYTLGIYCFRRALELRKDYGWAEAHLGALIVNARRCQPDGRDARSGLRHLQKANEWESSANPWTQAYIGCAHFALGLEELRQQHKPDPDGNVCKPAGDKPDGAPPDGKTPGFPSQLLICIAHILLGWDRAPHLLKHAVQPGAIILDRPFALLYDLIEILPFVPARDPSFREILAFAQTLALDDATNPEGGVERDSSRAVRLQHFKLFIKYLIEKCEPQEVVEEASTLLGYVDQFGRDIEIKRSTYGKFEIERDREILDDILSVELALLKVGAMFYGTDIPKCQNIRDRAVKRLISLNDDVRIVNGKPDEAKKHLEDACMAIAKRAKHDASILSPVSTLRYDYATDPKMRDLLGTFVEGLPNCVLFGRV